MGKKILFITFYLLLLCQVVFPQRKKLSINEIDTAVEIYGMYNSIIYDFNVPQPDRIYQHKLGNRKLITKPWFGKRAMLTVKINPYLYDVFVSSRQVVDGGINDSEALRRFTSALDTLAGNKGIEEVKKGVDRSPLPKPSSDIKIALENSGTSSDLADKIEKAAKPLNITNITVADSNRSIAALKLFSDEIKKAQDCYMSLIRYGAKYDRERKKFHDALDTFLIKASYQQKLLSDCEHLTAIMLMDNVDDKKIVGLVDNYCNKNIGTVDTIASKMSYWMQSYQEDMKSVFDELETVYTEMLEYSKLLCSESNTYKKSDSVSFEKIKKIRDQLSSTAPMEVAGGVSMMINNLLTGNSFSHPYHPVLVEKDTLAYTIVTRQSSRFASVINKYGIKLCNIDSFEYKIPTKGLFKLNFSVGMAFMYNSLRPTSYYLNPAIANVTGDSVEVSIKEGRKTNRFRPAIAALAHAYWKLGGDITPALTIGLSTNPTDFSDASYFLGLSGIMGHQNRFVFTIGISGSKVEYLKSRYDLNKKYYKIDFVNINDSDLSEKTFRAGMFFAASYNISSNR